MSPRGQVRAAEILLVEDSPADVRLTREALADAGVLSHLRVAADGVEAIDILRRRGGYSDAARPDLILLDLNLPKKDGREVLAEIKGDPDLGRIPVIVLTTSRAQEDILRAYQLHANAFVSKPVGFQEFLSAVRSLERFWLGVATLPHDGGAAR
jgi:CheY-like chemotaxis protein